MGEKRMSTPEERVSEYPFINILSKELGWDYVPPSELKKERDYNSALLKDRLMRALLRINAEKITEEDAKQIIKKLEYLPHTIKGTIDKYRLENIKNYKSLLKFLMNFLRPQNNHHCWKALS
ncbi:hypothetical protein [Thermococcus sp. PK]|uniref:hypothetical protein n=2 Tax=Thermococcus TaxID=2263 RepID=UPI0012EB651F|nr:hypothetical protein [Thermococcus sp. PK]